MTVKELIEQLQKLPQDNEIVADVLGDEKPAEVICARSRVFIKGRSYIAVDRSRWLQDLAEDIKAMREEELEVYQGAQRKEGQEDEDVW